MTTAREVKEWIGKPDQAIPTRVKLRITARYGGNCDVCGLPCGPLRKAEFDHRPALINGGENRESMIRLVCAPCHRVATYADVAEKSTTARIRAKHYGIKKPSRMPGSRNSKWRKKINGEVVMR